MFTNNKNFLSFAPILLRILNKTLMVRNVSYGMENGETFYMEAEIDRKADVALFNKQYADTLGEHMGVVYALNFSLFAIVFKMTYPFKYRFRLTYKRNGDVGLSWDDGKD